MYYADYRRRLRREEVSYPLGWLGALVFLRFCCLIIGISQRSGATLNSHPSSLLLSHEKPIKLN